MKKNYKILTLTLFSLALFGCSAQPINVLNNPKRSWGGGNTAPANNAFVYEQLMDSSTGGSIFQKMSYSPAFQDNLKYITANSSNIEKANNSAWYRFWNFILANGNETNIEDYIDNEVQYLLDNDGFRPGITELIDSSFVFYFPISKALKFRMTWSPQIDITYWNSEGIVETKKMSIEDLIGIANFGKTNFIKNFTSNDFYFINFRSMQFYYNVDIDTLDSLDRIITDEIWQQVRPKTLSGTFPEIIYKPRTYYNGFDSYEDRNFVNAGREYPTLNLNDNRIYYEEAPSITFKANVFSEFEANVLGLPINNEWIDGSMTWGPFNSTKAVRGQYMSHNWFMIEQTFDCNQVNFANGYREGYGTGYLTGQEDGRADWDWSNFLKSIFSGIDGFLQVEILPKIKLWYLVGIPLVFGLLKFILGWFR